MRVQLERFNFIHVNQIFYTGHRAFSFIWAHFSALAAITAASVLICSTYLNDRAVFYTSVYIASSLISIIMGVYLIASIYLPKRPEEIILPTLEQFRLSSKFQTTSTVLPEVTKTESAEELLSELAKYRDSVAAEPINLDAKGFVNPNSNCWIIAGLQMALNADKLLFALEKIEDKPPLVSALLMIRDIYQKQTRALESNISQIVRKLYLLANLPLERDPVSGYIYEQQDPYNLNYFFIEQAALFFTAQRQILFSKTKKQPSIATEKASCFIQLQMSKFAKEKEINFESLFLSYLNTSSLEVGYPSEPGEEKREFIDLPDDLFCSANRHSWDVETSTQSKIFTKIRNIPLNSFSIKNAKGEEAIYQLKACIIHSGDSFGAGHYIALTRKERRWFECNDSQVKELNADKVESYIEDGYQFHFTRVL